jgi:hypothetical protein
MVPEVLRPTSEGWAVRLTEEQYAELMRRRSTPVATVPLAKKPKYRNKRCQSADGQWFDSQLERDYYQQLLLRWKVGDVLWFIRQVNFELEGGVRYRADFLVVTPAAVEVVDTTGVMTQAKANKLKQVKARYGIDVQIVRSV